MTNSLNTLKANLAEMLRVLTLLPEQSQVVELHIPNTQRGMQSGYYPDFEKLARDAAHLSGSVPGVYITLVVATQTTA